MCILMATEKSKFALVTGILSILVLAIIYLQYIQGKLFSATGAVVTILLVVMILVPVTLQWDRSHPKKESILKQDNEQ
jgi:hypothetical protein